MRISTRESVLCRLGRALLSEAAAPGLVSGAVGHLQQILDFGGREVVNHDHFSTVEDGELVRILSGILVVSCGLEKLANTRFLEGELHVRGVWLL